MRRAAGTNAMQAQAETGEDMTVRTWNPAPARFGTTAQAPAQPGATTLFCLPPAGAGAGGYQPWRLAAPSWLRVLPVDLPARGPRIDEPAPRSMSALLEAVLPQIERQIDGARDAPVRYALFGHSMGAFVAFELARVLSGRGLPPVRLFVSGCAAPHLGSGLPPLSDRPIDAILDVLIGLLGMPAEVRAHPELISMMEQAVRGDLRIVEDYVLSPGPLLDCPITALCGDRDEAADAVRVAEWAGYTRADFALRSHPGGHALPSAEGGTVLSEIVKGLAAGVGR
jgi:medium-chain acyl-[acyl-carrier-protein] hydrolase